MSGHTPCTCKGTREERMKNWYIPEGYYKTNYSYFEKPRGQAHYSEYSTIRCTECHMCFRTKAKFVEQLSTKPNRT